MSKKMQSFSRRTKYNSFEESVRQTSNAVVSYEIPKKKFSPHDLKYIQPMSYSQERVFSEWVDGYSLSLTGSAGAGKSFLALALALKEVLSGQSTYHKIVLIRSTVPVRDQGFLPGSLEEKEEIYNLPYIALCDDIFKKKGQYQLLKDSGVIEFVSTSYLRGCTFKDSIVILDEAENCTYAELSTVCTRLDKSCKLMVLGDVRQTDLLYKKYDNTGYPEFLQLSKMMPSFRTITFGIEDCIRGGISREFLEAENRQDEIDSKK